MDLRAPDRYSEAYREFRADLSNIDPESENSARRWCCTPVIPACRRQRQKDLKFKAILVYRLSSRQGWD